MLFIVHIFFLFSWFYFFFFNDTATTEIYTLSLHDALPILPIIAICASPRFGSNKLARSTASSAPAFIRSEEHTSELQSQSNLVCRLLLEKKKKKRPRFLTLINKTTKI